MSFLLLTVFAPVWLLLCLTLFLRLEVFLLRVLVISPLVVPVLRARRYLADATAVALTRDPDAVAAGLAALRPVGTAAAEGASDTPGGLWLEHRFVVGRGGTTPAGQERPLTGTASPHPPLGRRLERLVGLGASPSRLAAGEGSVGLTASMRASWRQFRALPIGQRIARGLIGLFVLPLVALCAYLVLVILVTLVGLGAGGSVFFAAIALHFIQSMLIPA